MFLCFDVAEKDKHMSDPWNIGSLHKGGIWAYYTISNFVGVFLCSLLIYFIVCHKHRISVDVFVGGLAASCSIMSFTCGVQCLVNWAAGKFSGDRPACVAEAILHVSSILSEFFCVSCVAVLTYLRTVRKRDISVSTSIMYVIVGWWFCLLITFLLSFVSPMYLMSAGTYCFFDFTSPAIALWLVPGLVIALFIMVVCHFSTLSFLTQSAVSSSHNRLSSLDGPLPTSTVSYVTKAVVLREQFRWRSTILIFMLLLGWGFAAVTTVYELVKGESPEWLVTAVGVGGVSFSWAMPCMVALTSSVYGPFFRKFFCCGYCIKAQPPPMPEKRNSKKKDASVSVRPSRLPLTGPPEPPDSSPVPVAPLETQRECEIDERPGPTMEP